MVAVKAGLVLLVAGTWVLCQVLGGNALERLNITGPGATTTTTSGATTGDSGVLV